MYCNYVVQVGVENEKYDRISAFLDAAIHTIAD